MQYDVFGSENCRKVLNNRWCNSTGHCAHVFLCPAPEFKGMRSVSFNILLSENLPFCSHDLYYQTKPGVITKSAVFELLPNTIPYLPRNSFKIAIENGRGKFTEYTMAGEGGGEDPHMMRRRAELKDAYTQLLMEHPALPSEICDFQVQLETCSLSFNCIHHRLM